MKIGLIAMSGVRAHNEELTRLGLTLPGFVERNKTIASLPSLALLTLAALTPEGHEVEYLEIADSREGGDPPLDFDLVALSTYSAQIFEILQGVRDKMGATIMFITHSMASARYLCDRIGVIYRGHMVEQGPAEQVISSPRHPYTRALIDATPKFGRSAQVPTYDTLLAAERPATSQVGCPFFRRCAVAERLLCAGTYPPWRRVGGEQVALCHFVEDSEAVSVTG